MKKIVINGRFLSQQITGVQRVAHELVRELDNLIKEEKIEVVVPEKDGFFMIENLTGGKYKIILESINSPGKALYEKELEVSQTDEEEKLVELNILGDNEKNLKYELEIY
mgnify:CR=1 FL=1